MRVVYKRGAKVLCMTRTHLVRFFITESEYAVILTNARLAGFRNAASYARHMVIDYVSHLEERVVETNRIVKEINKLLKKGECV